MVSQFLIYAIKKAPLRFLCQRQRAERGHPKNRFYL